ncbi:MAG: CHAT domain-containing protein [Armatimonadetes bacterium]|nr:CHAT domain-containing protein [Armatimonadota bacterium]NIO97141.1 CHAT domain-containing protein [Armatimonadota bacterium]
MVFADNGLLFSDALLKHVEPFSNHPFVFLSSCLSGRARAYGGAFRGLPIAFLRLGAAAVVASVFPLADKPAASFATIFYEELLDGQTVGEAILQTRQAMFVQGINCLHWGRPILYGNPHARLVLPSR